MKQHTSQLTYKNGFGKYDFLFCQIQLEIFFQMKKMILQTSQRTSKNGFGIIFQSMNLIILSYGALYVFWK